MSICILLRWLLEPVNHPIVSSVAMRFCFASIAWMLRGITRPEIAKKFRQLLVAHGPDTVCVGHRLIDNLLVKVITLGTFIKRRVFRAVAALFPVWASGKSSWGALQHSHVSSSSSGGRLLCGQIKKQNSSSQASHFTCKMSQAQSKSSMLISTV